MKKGDVFGTGLGWGPYTLLLGCSITFFLLWDTPLWLATREATHLHRILYSYMVVVPLTAAALLWVGEWSWNHWINATGSLWGIKLVVTSTLFSVLSGGTSVNLVPSAVPEAEPSATAKAARALRYRPAPGTFAAGGLRGTVTTEGRPVYGAIVFLHRPGPGASLGKPRDVHVIIEDNRHDRGLYAACLRDRLVLHNEDDLMHTVHLHSGGRAASNRPLPAGQKGRMRAPAAGLYRIGCDAHAQEHSWLVSVDHPYWVESDAQGAYHLPKVAAGEVEIRAVAARGAVLLYGGVTADIAADGVTEKSMTLRPLPPGTEAPWASGGAGDG